MPYAKILLPVATPTPFDYRVPEGVAVQKGSIVSVPFGRKTETGVVWELTSASDVPAAKLKSVLEVKPIAPLSETFMHYIAWVAGYSLAPMGNVLAMALSAPQALEAVRNEVYVARGVAQPAKQTAARAKVLALLEKNELPKADVAELAGVSTSVVNALVKQGALVEKEVPTLPSVYPAYDAKRVVPPTLSEAQAIAAKLLRQHVADKKYAATLLDGVTGSGKTEVYLEAAEEALRVGRQVLILLPEIVLTSQLMARFEARLGFVPTPWHSALTPRQRREHWRAIHDGRAQLVVGARSALFLPYHDLALVVVDEEHATSYKQEDGVVYHARDMAVARGFTEGFPVVLVSATPSLETVNNVDAGKFSRVHLPERHGAATLPDIELIDMRESALDSRHWISSALKEAIIDTLGKQQQVLLYLNRRGYAPLTLCRTCGHRLQCPSCSAWLVTHKHPEGLQCHHCGYHAPVPKACPGCNAEKSLVACGPGVERLAEEVKELFPDARVVQMTSDTMENPIDAACTVKAILERETDIIIGTQMVAKGHHFPHLTLVGVVDADLGLEGGDLRAGEKAYQVLHQVAGRAGREDFKGRALIQTYQPQHPLMQALKAHNRDQFMAREKEQRQGAEMPPFGKLAAIVISGKIEADVRRFGQQLAASAPTAKGVRVLGPAPAPLSRLKGQHRYRLLLKAPRSLPLQKYLTTWLSSQKTPSALRLKVDIDPYSFM